MVGGTRELHGWFVEKKGETGADDTLVFFPDMRLCEPKVRAVTVLEKKDSAHSPRKAKKGER